MRVLAKSEVEMVSGAHDGLTHEKRPKGEPKFATDTGKDNGNHYGWCRGNGNTGRSNGHGNGLALPKHGNVGCMRLR